MQSRSTAHLLNMLVSAGAMILAQFSSTTASAAVLDTPALTWLVSGQGKVELQVTAGPSGTPGGFTLLWETRADFEAHGGSWLTEGNATIGRAHFWGEPTLNDFPGEPGTFRLGPNESITIQPGDMADESGVTANIVDELAYETDYVFAVFANAAEGRDDSEYSENVYGATTGRGNNCTFTIGYWKTHPETWPISSLMLGTVSYDQPELLSIFGEPVAGNGLISLAHQLIATKLNIVMGADDSDIAATVASADALIGGQVVPPVGSSYIHPSQTAGLTELLDDYNNGVIGPGHCPIGACCIPGEGCVVLTEQRCNDRSGTFQGGETPCDPETCEPSPTIEASWGEIKTIYRKPR